jgi:hypothetical protein
MHGFNPSYMRGGGRRIMVRGQSKQKLKTLPKTLPADKTTSREDWENGSSGRVLQAADPEFNP